MMGVCRSYSSSTFHINYIPSSRNIGFGAACNLAARLGVSGNIIFINCDTDLTNSVPEEFIKFLNIMDEADVVISGPLILDERGLVHSSCFSFDPISILLKPLRHVRRIGNLSASLPKNKSLKRRIDRISYDGLAKDHPTAVDWVSGCFLVVKRTFFEQVQGFDERYFMYFEDVDLCRKARQLSARVIYYPNFSIMHKARHESAKLDGVRNSLLKNRIARVHLASWVKYMCKWKRDFGRKVKYKLRDGGETFSTFEGLNKKEKK